jgi:hypothetical protein
MFFAVKNTFLNQNESVCGVIIQLQNDFNVEKTFITQKTDLSLQGNGVKVENSRKILASMVKLSSLRAQILDSVKKVQSIWPDVGERYIWLVETSNVVKTH